MTADEAARRKGYAAESELALRNAMEAFLRERRPSARMCHEMVMGGGTVRADLVAVDVSHIVAVEVKGEYDNTTRLLHQIGMYQICVPEVWMVVPEKHVADAKLVRHLLPSVGLMVAHGMDRSFRSAPDQPVNLTVEAEPEPRAVVPDMMLEMLWAAELAGVCDRTRTSVGKKSTRPNMIRALSDLPIDQLQFQTCIALRARDALWRADTPISIVEQATTNMLKTGPLL